MDAYIVCMAGLSLALIGGGAMLILLFHELPPFARFAFRLLAAVCMGLPLGRLLFWFATA